MSIGLQVSVAVLVGTTVGVVGDDLFVTAVSLGIAVGALAVLWPRRAVGLAALACVAMAGGAHARSVALAPPPSAWLSGDTIELSGILQSDAVVTPTGIRVDVLVERWRVRATVAGEVASHEYMQWTKGRTFAAPMRLRRPDPVRNPGSPSVTWQALNRRFDAIGTIKSALLVSVTPGASWDEVAARTRRHVRTVAATWLAPHSPSSQAVVTAILIGDRAGLDESITRRLQAAGTFHVIAISGGNIAILTVACFLCLRLVTRGHVLPVVVTLLVVVGYGQVVSSEASVVRAVLAAVVYLLLRLVGLPPRPLNLLAIVAVLCVVWKPLTVLDVGAWLSFGATFGLIVVLPRLLAAVRGPDFIARGWRRVWDGARAAVLATVAAEIMILPVTAGVFSRVGIAGLLLNLTAIPAMVVAQFAGLVLCVVAPLSATLAGLAAVVAHWATVVLLGSSGALDIAPWLSWRVPPTSLWWVACYYAAVGTALLWTRPRWRGWSVALAGVLALVIVTSPFVAASRPQRGWLRVTMLDVGQGDATLIQTPNRRALLVDAGGTPTGTFDIGGRIVTPAVWALGERRIDWLALTHGDLDHVGGARRVMDDLRPGEVWEGIPVEQAVELLELRAAAQRRQITWRRMFAGHELDVGAVQILVRHPARPDWERPRVRNDDSLVLEVRYGDVSVVLPGDAGVEYESVPVERPRAGARPRIRILKVAHHGSQSSTSAMFLDRYDPRVAVVSAGASNLFGHPAPAVLARLRARDVHLFRTDLHGAVIIETDGRQVRVRGVAGGRLDVF